MGGALGLSQEEGGGKGHWTWHAAGTRQAAGKKKYADLENGAEMPEIPPHGRLRVNRPRYRGGCGKPERRVPYNEYFPCWEVRGRKGKR